MSFRGYILMAAGLLFVGALVARAVENAAWQELPTAQTQNAPQSTAQGPAKEAPKRTPIDLMADDLEFDEELNARLGLDERAAIYVGEVVFHHNGAVISCDSAIQYSARHIECFQNVIINQDSTFVYADRAEYNGDENLAKVFSPIIKIVDGSSTIYTYNFEFNTLDRVGRWYGGGVIYQDGNEMESERGYYFTTAREMVAVDAVQLRGDGHQMMSDSVRYNTVTKLATFYTPTTIWTDNEEMISARRGRYYTADSTYFFQDNAYVLTPTREIWADSMDYSSMTGHALLMGNAQIDDNDNLTSAWGDRVEYWAKPWVDSLTGVRRERGEAMLTKRPTIANYNADEGNGDTLYMGADTFFLYIAYRSLPPRDSASTSKPSAMKDSLPEAASDTLPVVDSLSAAAEPLSRREQKMRAREVKDSLRVVRIAAKAEAKASARAAKAEARALRKAEKAAARRAKAAVRKGIATDSLIFSRQSGVDVAPTADSVAADSISNTAAATEQGGVKDAPLRREKAQPDSVLRTFKGWHSVKIWRPDFSAVADSLIGFSADSTIRLYKDPLLWHGDNQIDSDSVAIFTANEKIARAEFYGSPIMSMQVDENRFNQVKGRAMTSLFRDNALYRHDVMGNAEAVYYMQEDPPVDTTVVFDPSPIAFEALTASEISFLIDSQTVRYIIPRLNVVSTTYPMDQIPPSEPTRLQGFRWYGERRPQLADVFSRQWRPSARAQSETIEKPTFPIASRIEIRRNYLVSNRMWVDRSEPLPAYAVEFRNEVYRPQ